MKSATYILIAIVSTIVLASCEKRDYNHGGLPEFENVYYAGYIPNDNSSISVTRPQTALIKLPVQFYSSFTRSYDAVANYAIVTTGITNPAVLGQDFNIVDKNGNVLQPTNGKFSMVFPQAKRLLDTIYIKVLNSSLAGARKMEVQLQENQTEQYTVKIFTTAFRRPVEIK